MSLKEKVKNLWSRVRRKRNQANQPAQTAARVATPTQPVQRIIKLSERPNKFRQMLKNNGIIFFSILAIIIYLGLITIGAAVESGLMIAIVGSITALYFFAISFLLEKSPSIFASLLKGWGFDLQNNEWPDDKKESVKQLRFLSVPIAGFSAYLAFYPSWEVYTFLFVLTIIALFLSQITYWLEKPSNIWIKIHSITKWAALAFLIAFVTNLIFPANYKGLRDYGVKRFNNFIVWLKTPSKPKPKPKAVAKRVEVPIPIPVSMPVPIAEPAPAPQPAPKQVEVQPASRKRIVVQQNTDLNKQAALAAYLKMEEMDREDGTRGSLKKVEKKVELPMPAQKVIPRRVEIPE